MKRASYLVPVLFIASACSTGIERATPENGESTASAKLALSRAAGKALQGQMRRALGELESVHASEFGHKDRLIRSCILDRFQGVGARSAPAHVHPFVNQVIGAYRDYWRTVLLDPENRVREEETLHGSLAGFAGLPAATQPSVVDNEIRKRLESEGLHALTGRTPPLLELIVWEDESRRSESVRLPEGRHEVTVHILDDFASLGWSAYATCDRSFTGGWVKTDAIYAVRPGWKSLDEENFRISFLAHETQHFADRRRFGDLESWELEYRGKLTELALAEKTVPKLLSSFASNQSDDPAIPHSYANKRALADLRRQLAISPETKLEGMRANAINRAAYTLLLGDSARRVTSHQRGSSADGVGQKKGQSPVSLVPVAKSLQSIEGQRAVCTPSPPEQGSRVR